MAGTAGAAVSLRDLTKHFPARTRAARENGITAVDHLSLEVARGERFGLLGPNGAGKTTTFLILSTLLAPTAGTAVVEGFDVQRSPAEVRRRIGVLLAGDRAVYRRLTGRENLLYFAELYGLSHAKARERAAALLDLVGLGGRADDLTGRYSTGMRMRLALARTVLHNPTVLLLDEPTLGLDPHGAHLVRDLILSLGREEKTVLLATHDLAEAERLCDRVAVIDQGRVVAVGRPADLWRSVEGTDRAASLEEVFLALTRQQA